MGNHIHILIKTPEEPLEKIFRRIGASSVYWYNLKYQRAGHLFQDRFKSEAVEDDRYFLTVLRYILRNPVKAGLCISPADYPYSNINDFLNEKKSSFPSDISEKELLEFITQDEDDSCMDVADAPRKGVTESTAKELIRNEFGDVSPVINSKNRESTELSIQRLSEKGLSIHQLSRLTGISKSIIERILR